jgi:rhodanese-related sulfurtransferase
MQGGFSLTKQIAFSSGGYQQAWAHGVVGCEVHPGTWHLGTSYGSMQRDVSYRFLFSDALGSAIWAGAWIFGGRVIAREFSETQLYLSVQWRPFMVGLVCLFVVLSFWRVFQHLKFGAVVRALQLEPDQLHDLITSAAAQEATPPFIIDLRQAKDFQHNPFRLPNALRLTPNALRRSVGALPKDRDVILYCSCPSQATSTFWAMRLSGMGAQRVRLLHGGWEAWRDAGYPLEPRDDLSFVRN